MKMQMFDSLALDSSEVRTTRDGYLVARPRVSRTGIQIYAGKEVGKPEMDVVRVYRPENEVMHLDSRRSYAFRPITNDHPPEPVTADNWKKYAVGQTGDEIARDGDAIRVPAIFMDSAVIKDIQNGKRQLSLGYSTDLKWESGVTPAGEQYDAVQTNIRANHLAVVASARGGPQLSIGDKGATNMTVRLVVDGVPVEVSDAAAAVFQRALADRERKIADMESEEEKEKEKEKEKTMDRRRRRAKDEFPPKKEEEEEKEKEKATDRRRRASRDEDPDEEPTEEEEEEETFDRRLKTKDAQIATLRKQLADAQITPQKLDDLVKDRALTVAKARTVLPTVVIDGKTLPEIRRQVVDAKLGAAAQGWDDKMVTASFNTLTVGAAGSSPQQTAADQLAFAFQPHRQHTVDAAEAYNTYDKGLTERWRKSA